jgi:hypothetical protein
MATSSELNEDVALLFKQVNALRQIIRILLAQQAVENPTVSLKSAFATYRKHKDWAHLDDDEAYLDEEFPYMLSEAQELADKILQD